MSTLDLKGLFSRLSPVAGRIFDNAIGFCMTRTHYEVTVEHVLLKALEEPDADITVLLAHYGVNIDRFRRQLLAALDTLKDGNPGRPTFAPVLIDWVTESWLIGSVDFRQDVLRTGLLAATLVLRPGRFVSREWRASVEGMPRGDLSEHLLEIMSTSGEEPRPVSEAPERAFQPGEDSALARFTHHLTAKAREGSLDPVIGRDREIRQMVDVLSRRRKNNPIIVGEAGVGKTALVEGLALRIVSGDVPPRMADVEILALDIGLLTAGASVKGEFENRMKSVISEAQGAPRPVVLFVDEAHTIIGAGAGAGGTDAANLLKPVLARGELRLIAATTWKEYKKHFEKDPALTRRFQPVKVGEPDIPLAIDMLRGLKSRYEAGHDVVITDGAVIASVEMSARYLSGRQLPDKAVDLLDTAAARVQISLSTTPAPIDDLAKRMRAVERSLEALERDERLGIPGPPGRREALEEKLRAHETAFEALQEKWATEKRLAGRVLDLRKAIEAGDEGTEGTETASQEAGAAAPEEPAGSPFAPTDAGIEKASGQGGPKGDSGTGHTAPLERPSSQADQPVPGEPPVDSLDATPGAIEEALEALHRAQGEAPLVQPEVSPHVVAEVLEDWTGIPVGTMVRDEVQAVLELEERLRQRIKGQDHALKAIAECIRRARAGIQNPRQPLGVFLLVGSSGVGKTETALAVADLLFGGEQFMTSINMSEFQEEHTVSRLIGSPPGYVGYGEGGVLTEAVRQRPYSVVLLDEIEKSAPKVMNLFYQVFDKGVLADGEGREIDFKNTVIFMTSNLATDIIVRKCAEDPDLTAQDLDAAIRPSLAAYLKPALLARMTVVPYFALSLDVLKEITVLKLERLAARVARSHRTRLTYTDDVVAHIATRSTAVDSGARNIDHLLRADVMPLLSKAVLSAMAEGRMPGEMKLIREEDAFRVEAVFAN